MVEIPPITTKFIKAYMICKPFLISEKEKWRTYGALENNKTQENVIEF
jgi:hypothetical protein